MGSDFLRTQTDYKILHVHFLVLNRTSITALSILFEFYQTIAVAWVWNKYLKKQANKPY